LKIYYHNIILIRISRWACWRCHIIELTRKLVPPPRLIWCISCIYSNRRPVLRHTCNTIRHKRTSSTGPCSLSCILLRNRTVGCHLGYHTCNMWNCTEGRIWLFTAFHYWRGNPISDNPRKARILIRLRLIRRASTSIRYSTKSRK